MLYVVLYKYNILLMRIVDMINIFRTVHDNST